MYRTMNVAISTSVLALAAGCATPSALPGRISLLGNTVVDCRPSNQVRCVIPLRVEERTVGKLVICTVYAEVGTINVHAPASGGLAARVVWKLVKGNDDKPNDLSLYEFDSEGLGPEKFEDWFLMHVHFRDRGRENEFIELDSPPAQRFRWVSRHIESPDIHYIPRVLRNGKPCHAADPIIRNL